MNKKVAITATLIVILASVLTASALATGFIVGPFASEGQKEQVQHDPMFYNTLGYHLAQEGRNYEAQAAFAQAVMLDSSYVSARNNLATVAFANEDYLTAITQLRWLVAHDSAHQQYQFDLAQNLVHQARYKDYDIAKLEEAATIYEGLGKYPHAAENAAIIRNVLADVTAAQAGAGEN